MLGWEGLIEMLGRTHPLDIQVTYIVTRWYRAPELLLDLKTYTNAIDIWSFGCIVAEMLGRKPLFKGSSSKHQLKLILEVLGKPSPEDVEATANVRYYDMMNRLQLDDGIRWCNLYPRSPKDIVELMSQCIRFNPDSRVTAEEALAHPAFSSLLSDEPMAIAPFDFETDIQSPDEVRKLIDSDAKLNMGQPEGVMVRCQARVTSPSRT